MDQNGADTEPQTWVRSDAETYRRHAQELTWFATVLVGPDKAQDVVANAFARCFRSDGWQRANNQRAYLFRAVANEANNMKRADARRQAREARYLVARPDPVVEMPVPRPEIHQAIRSLSLRQRAVIYLAYWEDKTDDMIADYLGISSGSVRSHLARARSRLREVLDE